MSTKYSVKLTNLQEEFTNMQASHAQELSDMKQQHSQELDNLQEQQSQELLNLKKQHTKDLTDLQELHSKSISDLQELQQLINEREQLNVPLNLRELKNVVQGLDQSQIAITGGSISAIFTAIKNAIEAKRNTNTKEIEDRTQKSKNEKMDPDLVPQDGR